MKRLVYFRKEQEFQLFDDSDPLLDVVDFTENMRFATPAELIAYRSGRSDKATEIIEALARERFGVDKEQP